MSTPIYFTCGAFVCDAEGDAHELATCIFDARKTSRRRAKQRVTRLIKGGFRLTMKPVLYTFKGVPCDTELEEILEALRADPSATPIDVIYPGALAEAQVTP